MTNKFLKLLTFYFVNNDNYNNNNVTYTDQISITSQHLTH